MSRTDQISAAIDALVGAPESTDADEQMDRPATRPRAVGPTRRHRRTPARSSDSRPLGAVGARSSGALSVQLDGELLEACRDATAFLSGPPLHLTLRAFVEAALRDRLHTELKRAHSLGLLEEEAEVFPSRGQELRVGRPLVRA